MSKKTGVIGFPIKHSKSPIIHNYWMRRYDIKGAYDAYEVKPENFETNIKNLIEKENLVGFNVTVPHKQAIMNLCDTLDPTAKQIGAVNTISIENGQIFGMNTDVFGFVENLKTAERNFGYGWNLSRGRAVVLGAGGACRAVLYGLLQERVPEIILTNRTLEKAQELASINPAVIKPVEWDERNDTLEGANFVVNTTSLGMEGQAPLEIDLGKCPEEAVVHDIVYAPLYTELLKQARAHDLRIVTGIGMLLHQARPAFDRWYNLMPDVNDKLEELVL